MHSPDVNESKIFAIGLQIYCLLRRRLLSTDRFLTGQHRYTRASRALKSRAPPVHVGRRISSVRIARQRNNNNNIIYTCKVNTRLLRHVYIYI
jgi:hypothetical protein